MNDGTTTTPNPPLTEPMLEDIISQILKQLQEIRSHFYKPEKSGGENMMKKILAGKATWDECYDWGQQIQK